MDAHVTAYRATETWRRVCEARARLRQPLEQRRHGLAQVEKKRGMEARRILERDMLEQFQLRRQGQWA